VRKSPRTGEKFYQLSYVENGVQKRPSLGPVTGPTAKSAAEVELLRKAKEIELEGGPQIFVAATSFATHLDGAPARPGIPAVNGYLTWHKRKYPSSHYRVKQICDQHFGTFRGLSLPAVTAELIETWVGEREQKVGPESVAKELRTLHAVLEKAVEWNRGITKNPADNIDPPQNLTSEPKRWYTQAERDKLYARPRHGHAWKFIANVGMRRGEFVKAKKADVRWDEREIVVKSAPTGRTKSGKYREIPLTDAAIEALRALFEQYPDIDTILPKMNPASWSRAFANDVKACKLRRIPGSLVHALRHCYGSGMGSADVPIRTLQLMMGHAHIATTQKYVNPDKENQHRHTRRVGRL
jgi:integrase